ncbi:MAG: twin-arginine translocase TatA/TatE family subunit [Planctomycetales bacterium]|nr:twin-arginine translocase TatA/TatE family subunit [Planctomycetales bacterium]
MLLAFFGAPGWVELMVVGLIVLLLFGNRLPSVMRSLGQGITEFKKGVKSGETDVNGEIEDHGKSQ